MNTRLAAIMIGLSFLATTGALGEPLPQAGDVSDSGANTSSSPQACRWQICAAFKMGYMFTPSYLSSPRVAVPLFQGQGLHPLGLPILQLRRARRTH